MSYKLGGKNGIILAVGTLSCPSLQDIVFRLVLAVVTPVGDHDPE